MSDEQVGFATLVDQLEAEDFEDITTIIGANPAESLVSAAQGDCLGVGGLEHVPDVSSADPSLRRCLGHAHPRIVIVSNTSLPGKGLTGPVGLDSTCCARVELKRFCGSSSTWQFGTEVKSGEPYVVWRRIDTHAIFRSP